MKIDRFLNEDFASFSLPKGPRDGKFVIELPKIASANKFREISLATIPEELQSCHPLLRRRKITVRFVTALEESNDPSGEKGTNGDILELKNAIGETQYLIRIVLDESNTDEDSIVATFVGIILHEIAETDYYLKSRNGIEYSSDLLGTPEYHLTEDEEVANRRAIRAIRRFYPHAKFTNIIYPQDR